MAVFSNLAAAPYIDEVFYVGSRSNIGVAFDYHITADTGGNTYYSIGKKDNPSSHCGGRSYKGGGVDNRPCDALGTLKKRLGHPFSGSGVCQRYDVIYPLPLEKFPHSGLRNRGEDVEIVLLFVWVGLSRTKSIYQFSGFL
jgi:hypothetical protein